MTTEEETTTTKPPPNLLTCEAAALASYLLEHRFQNNAVETASFLLECTSTLPNAEAISAELMGEQPQEGASTSNDLGKALTEPCTVSMTAPRGKFQVTLHEGGIECVNNKGDKLVIPAGDAVERMVVFPKPQDCRKTTASGDMILLCFSEQHAVEFQKKPLKQVCFQLPDTTTDKPSWLKQLCSSVSLEETQVAVVPHPKRPKKNGYSFRSHDEGSTSTTTGGMPFVQCYHGVKDGVLYPMEEGLLFFKPPMFLPRSSLTSIACGRGTGGSRYVDMTLTLDEDGGELEFTNIHRDELAGLNDYIHSTLIPAMQRDADGGSSNGNKAEDTTQDDSAEDSIESNDSKEDDNSTTALGKRKRAQRKASREAREATRAQLERRQDSDSDDDEGWEAGHGGEDDSDDEEDAVEDEDDGGDVEDEFFEEEDEPAVKDGGNVEEEFFEEDSGTATESDD